MLVARKVKACRTHAADHLKWNTSGWAGFPVEKKLASFSV